MNAVVVGIDGSQAAISAALWGTDEAISRGVPLRLVSVLKPTHPSTDDCARDLEHADMWLRRLPERQRRADSARRDQRRGGRRVVAARRGPAGIRCSVTRCSSCVKALEQATFGTYAPVVVT
ncbi:MAG: universal stress protein [Mycobacterium sp.]